MKIENIFYITPEIFLTCSIVFLLGYGVIYSKIGGKVEQLKNITNLSILTLILTLFLFYLIPISSQTINIGHNILGLDGLSVFIKSIVLILGIIVFLMSFQVYTKKNENLVDYEYSQLILWSILGMLLLVSSRDMIVMYLSIETLSLSLYVLATIRRLGQYSTEAGLKYLILGALSSGLLLFGGSLIYITTGLTDWESIGNYIWVSDIDSRIGLELGSIFILLALLFKLGGAPLHMWLPDVYEGSPTIVTAFFSLVPKISILGIMISLIYGPFLAIFTSTIQPVLIISGVLSITIGSIAAINQTKIKRLFAYSAIAHIGWIILGLAIGTTLSLQAAFIYILLYLVMTINSFCLILSYYKKGYGNLYVIELSGLSRKEPILAITFTLSLLSIAGIPPLAGFFSKYNLLLALIDENYILLSILIVILSVIGSFYYIRIIQWMYFNNSKDYILKDLGDLAEQTLNLDLIKSILLGLTSFIIITYLIYPNPLLILTFDSINSILI